MRSLLGEVSTPKGRLSPDEGLDDALLATVAHPCRDSARIIGILLASGADRNVRNRSGGTLLHELALQTPVAVDEDYDNVLEILRTLVAVGVDPAASDDQGRSAFDVAQAGCKEIDPDEDLFLAALKQAAPASRC